MTIDEAFQIIDEDKNKLPFDAIQFLYEHEPNDIIEQKILDGLREIMEFRATNEDESTAAIGYLIVAERYLTMAMFEVIHEFILTSTSDYVFDDEAEQSQYVLYLICKDEKIGNNAIGNSLDTIATCIASQSDKPYQELYFTVIPLANHTLHKKKILSFFEGKPKDFLTLVMACTDANIKEIIVYVEKEIEAIKKGEDSSEVTDDFLYVPTLLESIAILKGDEEVTIQSDFQDRLPWDEHYEGWNDMPSDFDDKTSEVLKSTLVEDMHKEGIAHKPSNYDFQQEAEPQFEPRVNDVTIGRNDPCPCGSGKKYKKCCMKQ